MNRTRDQYKDHDFGENDHPIRTRCARGLCTPRWNDHNNHRNHIHNHSHNHIKIKVIISTNMKIIVIEIETVRVIVEGFLPPGPSEYPGPDDYPGPEEEARPG